MRKPRTWLLTAAVVLAAIGCGDSNPVGPGTSGNTMTANVDGQAWSAVPAIIQVVRNQGIIAIGGASTQAIGIGIAFPDQGPGTYTIGPTAVTNANVVDGSDTWIAGSTNGSGSIVVTTLTSTNVAGTFSFTAAATGGATPATRQVTSGAFDVEF
jgi:hypothetical protein